MAPTKTFNNKLYKLAKILPNKKYANREAKKFRVKGKLARVSKINIGQYNVYTRNK